MSDVAWITCATAGCGHSPFPIDKQFEQRARETHESFYCPAGHSLSWKIESRKERNHRLVVEQLKRESRSWEAGYYRERREARRCPWPTCRTYVYASRDSMYEHMRRIHDMPILAAVRDAS